jgi:diguanylate cyclase (GGDEF)-like protein
VRESDTVARLGGDEFVVLLPETLHVEDAATVAQKIIETVREPVAIGNRQYFLGVSIGLALFPDHASNAERLLQQADIAMYIAKRRGGSALQCAIEPDVSSGEMPRNPSSTEHGSRKDS